MSRGGDFLGKPAVYTAAAVVFGMCAYAFCLGTDVYNGTFKNDPLAWYFLAKGVFCATSLVLTHAVLEALRGLRE
jgi:hypothetical protein